MKAAPQPSTELAQAIDRLADTVYGSKTFDIDAFGPAELLMMEVDRRVQGSPAQQLAIGTLVMDIHGDIPEIEEPDMSDGSGDMLPERVMIPLEDGYLLDREVLLRIADALLATKASARETVMAYSALRIAGATPSELGELHAATIARGIVETAHTADTLTRVYSRRVLALIAEHPDDIFAVVRQAQDEGTPFEVIKLVLTGHDRLPPERAMSLLAIGVNAASDIDRTDQEMHMVHLQLQTGLGWINALHNAAPSEEQFESDERARGLAGEFSLFAEAFARHPGYEPLFMHALISVAFARAILGQRAEAEDALVRLQAFGSSIGGLPKEIETHLQHIEGLLASRYGTDAASAEPDTDDEDDDPTTRADWWKNS